MLSFFYCYIEHIRFPTVLTPWCLQLRIVSETIDTMCSPGSNPISYFGTTDPLEQSSFCIKLLKCFHSICRQFLLFEALKAIRARAALSMSLLYCSPAAKLQKNCHLQLLAGGYGRITTRVSRDGEIEMIDGAVLLAFQQNKAQQLCTTHDASCPGRKLNNSLRTSKWRVAKNAEKKNEI